jgi:hypothetical protein
VAEDDEKTVTDFLKSMTIKDFIYLGATAWNAVTAKTIEACWMRGLGRAFMADCVPLDDVEAESQPSQSTTEQADNADSDEEFLGFSSSEVEEVSYYFIAHH